MLCTCYFNLPIILSQVFWYQYLKFLFLYILIQEAQQHHKHLGKGEIITKPTYNSYAWLLGGSCHRIR